VALLRVLLVVDTLLLGMCGVQAEFATENKVVSARLSDLNTEYDHAELRVDQLQATISSLRTKYGTKIITHTTRWMVANSVCCVLCVVCCVCCVVCAE